MNAFVLILPAAGRSTRYGGARSKLLEPLAGSTVIGWAIRPFLKMPDLRRVIIPCGDPTMIGEAIQSELPAHTDDLIDFCSGGETRAESVLAALKRVPDDIEWVAIHDAARPLISAALIRATLAAAEHHGAAVPATPVTSTVKQADGPLPALVQRTLPRHTLWAMQTPQVARRTTLLHAYENCRLPMAQITDDMQLLELVNEPICLVAGEERNLKITTAMDLHVAQLWLQRKPDIVPL